MTVSRDNSFEQFRCKQRKTDAISGEVVLREGFCLFQWEKLQHMSISMLMERSSRGNIRCWKGKRHG